MSEISFRINPDGTIDICLGSISLTGIYPCIEERPVVPVQTETGNDCVVYSCDSGTVTSRIRKEGGRIVLSTSLSGFGSIHDAEPLGSAIIKGADRAYVQGVGMEGPSGYHEIDAKLRRSHGIIGLGGEGCAAAAFTMDQRRYAAEFTATEHEGIYAASRTLSAGINLECTVCGSVQLPDIYFIAGRDAVECMSDAAKMIADEMHARTAQPPAFHWCSWYYHYENMSQEILDGFLADLESEPADGRTDFNYIQIDAGYTPHVGDWLTFNHRYPGGLSRAASSILDRGYAAGIWIAPFMVGDQSRLYSEHPDWVVHNKDGTPFVRFRSYTEPKIWGNTDNDYYVLDMTHPDASSYLREVFRTYRQYGFTLFKTDFLLWGMMDSSDVVRYDNTRTSVMIMRDTLQMIREEIGEESYLLGSIAPFMPCIGYVDGMRIASDMGAQWTDGAFGPANLLQELPYDNYFNNVYWQNDPDSVILRQFATHLTDEETWSIALLQALSGGIITTSDPVTQLGEDRRRLLGFIRPDKKHSADMPYLTDDREEIVITHSLIDWNLLYVLNPTDHPMRICYRMDELFGTEAFFQYRFDWNGGDVTASGRCESFSDTLAPHTSALVFLTEEPLTEKPSNLWCRN